MGDTSDYYRESDEERSERLKREKEIKKKKWEDLVEPFYWNCRKEIELIEKIYEFHCDSLSEKERKRLDKAITCIKVGIKIVKKVLKNKNKTLPS